MKQIYAEFICNNCGQAEHFLHPYSNAAAKKMGWIIISKEEHYCSKKCYKESKGDFYYGL